MSLLSASVLSVDFHRAFSEGQIQYFHFFYGPKSNIDNVQLSGDLQISIV